MAYMPNVLASLEMQDSRDFAVTVVDNASSDGIASWLQDQYPHVALLRNFRNQGFSRGHNQAIALACSRWADASLEDRYIMVTNPDLEFAPDAVRILMQFMIDHPEVGACGPKLLRSFWKEASDDERRESIHSTCIDSTGLVITKARRAYDRGAGEEDKGQYDHARDVFGLSGACVVFRASALIAAKIGEEYFDEDMFAYQEDVDLAWRMRRLGFRAEYVPEAVVWHHRRAPSAPRAGWFSAWKSRQKKSPFVNFLSTRNHGWVLLKNDEWQNALRHILWWLPYELAKFIVGFLSFAQLKGEVASFAGIGRMLKKRRELRARVRAAAVNIRPWFV